MPATLGRTLLIGMFALAVALGSFWLTLKILDNSATPVDPNADLIEVTEATYGMNCEGSAGPGGQANLVKAGNATAALAKLCTNARESCAFAFDVNQIGDPAPGCFKDLSIGWRCGAGETVNRVHVAAEANSKRISLACPAP
jgi:hypothetical protein